VSGASGEPPRFWREGDVFVGNRWALLADFSSQVEAEGLSLGPQTALVLDLDKTTLGARSRNDGVVDLARVDGVRATVAALLGERFDQAAFERAYGELNRPAYHPFTADNQDYLAYICLAVGAGMIAFEELLARVQGGKLQNFQEFLAAVAPQARAAEPRLRALHEEIVMRAKAGDPIPLKEFRRREYLATVARFGRPSGEAPIEARLRDEVLITQEVRQAALAAGRRGALVFGLSDKPDEASFPPLGAQGLQPLHHTPTHAYGESLPAPWGTGDRTCRRAHAVPCLLAKVNPSVRHVTIPSFVVYPQLPYYTERICEGVVLCVLSDNNQGWGEMGGCGHSGCNPPLCGRQNCRSYGTGKSVADT